MSVTRRLLLTALVLSGCSAPESPCGPSRGTVDYVVDGDTLELVGGMKVRLLLVDAPETTQGHNDCFGQEAKAFTVSQVAGKEVSLRYDDASCLDRYMRTLAYVSVNGVELNTQLAKQGLACFLYIAPGGSARQEEFATYEAEARTNRTGMWGQCSAIPCSQ